MIQKVHYFSLENEWMAYSQQANRAMWKKTKINVGYLVGYLIKCNSKCHEG